MTSGNLTPKKALRTAAWRRTFLTVLRNTANVRASCEKAGITRARAYQVKDADTAFSAQWDEAVEDAVDSLEEIARQRARKTSDVLLIFLLKAHRPGKYREVHRQEITGANGGPIKTAQVFDHAAAVAAIARRSMPDSDEPGVDEDRIDG